MTGLEIILLIILVCLAPALAASIYANINMLKKSEDLEDNYRTLSTWFLSFKGQIDSMNSKMKQIDYKGSFEADDEIGFMFKEVKSIQEKLNEYFE